MKCDQPEPSTNETQERSAAIASATPESGSPANAERLTLERLGIPPHQIIHVTDYGVFAFPNLLSPAAQPEYRSGIASTKPRESKSSASSPVFILGNPTLIEPSRIRAAFEDQRQQNEWVNLILETDKFTPPTQRDDEEPNENRQPTPLVVANE